MALGGPAALSFVLQHLWGFSANSPILFASISMQLLHAFIAEPFATLEQTGFGGCRAETRALMTGLKRPRSPCLALPCLQHLLPQGADQMTGFPDLAAMVPHSGGPDYGFTPSIPLASSYSRAKSMPASWPGRSNRTPT